jgi:hypothetical protein
MNIMYDPGREGILDDTIAMSTGDIRAMLLLSTYTFSAAHKFLADLGAADNGRSAALISKTFASGVFDAADSSAVATAALSTKAVAIFLHTGSDATARLLAYIDEMSPVQVAVAAGGGATSITVEDLPDGIASGAVLSLVSGSGPATITTSASAAAGARTLAVTALGSALSVDAIYAYKGTSSSGLPMTPAAGQTINLLWDNSGKGIFKI